MTDTEPTTETPLFGPKGVTVLGNTMPWGAVIGWMVAISIIGLLLASFPEMKREANEKRELTRQHQLALSMRVEQWAIDKDMQVTTIKNCIGREEAGTCMLSSDPTKAMMKIVCEPDKCFREW